jgi:microcystin-dependent protein
MATPFVAEIRIFPFNFPPKGWAFCDGQILPISQNTALFSLLGTTYGGDGKSNFALPNLQGSNPMQSGQGPGLSLRDLGESAGEDTVTLLVTEMASHSHTLNADNSQASSSDPSNNFYTAGHYDDGKGHSGGVQIYQVQQPPADQLNQLSVGFTGGSQPHNNLMPYLTLNFCIALQGIYPPRT